MEKRKDKDGRVLHTGELQRLDGRYQFSKMVNGRRKTIYAMSLKELRKKEKSFLKEIEDGIDRGDRKRSLNEQFTCYINAKSNLADTTVAAYYYLWEHYVMPFPIAEKEIGEIKKSDILFLYRELSDRGLSPRSIQNVHNILYPCLQLAVDDQVLRWNPVKNCMKEVNAKKEEYKKTVLSMRQQKILLEFLKTDKHYRIHYHMVRVMLGTACRCSELIGLTWDDVHMNERYIDINHQLIYKKINGVTTFRKRAPKTKKGIRKIPMSTEVYEILEEQRKRQIENGIDGSICVDGLKGFVFTTAKGRPMQPNCMNQILENIVNAYNRKEERMAAVEERVPERLPHISAHTLRHTGCTRMAEAGMNVKALQYIMGHENITTTMDIYNHVEVEQVFAEMRKIDSASRA